MAVVKSADRRQLKTLLQKGVAPVRVFKRARVLQLIDEGESIRSAAKGAGVAYRTARRIHQRYHEGGLQRALYDLPRPGAQPLLNKRQESQIIAIVCSAPPKGFARWSISLLRKAVLDRQIIDKIGDETIRLTLHRHDLKPWREKNVVRSRTR